MPTKKKTARKPARKPVKKTAKKAAKKPTRRAAARPERRKRHEPETLRLRSAAPGFTCNDLQKSLAFYTEVLGFTVKDRFERDGKLQGVEMAAGAVTFYISQDDWQKGRDRKKGEGFRIYCMTAQDVDSLAARIKAKGVALYEEPKNQPWGTRDFAVSDPDGFKVTIGSEPPL
jgi:uncharacterized glyoxalase superfamily protein PhnB